jgi:hypothetical protein
MALMALVDPFSAGSILAEDCLTKSRTDEYDSNGFLMRG